MTQITRFNYSNDKQITAQVADSINDYEWVAFAQNSDGNCIIEKEAKFYPTQTYYSLERAVTEVKAMDVDSTKLYVAYDDTTYLGEIISKTNPLTSTTSISKGSYTESPIDVKINGSDLWLLLPGEASGENAKLLKYNTSGVFQQEVDLTKSGSTVNYARTMTIDGSGDIWLATYQDPAKIVHVYAISGGLYDFTIDESLV